MRFPVEGLCGNYIPVFGRENGMPFPVEGLDGKCNPEFVIEAGCGFPTGPQAGNRIPLRTRILGHGFQRAVGRELHGAVIKLQKEG